ncbi:MAG: hypothetical protein LBG68_04165 [Coriobacteriales bacterium]|nr:hypothetical protein [Coriobacteriales bacterium]
MSQVDTLFSFFIAHQDQLVKEHYGKVIILHGSSVAGVFEDYLTAFLFGKKHFKPGSFIIQKCLEGEDAYTATIPLQGVSSCQ